MARSRIIGSGSFIPPNRVTNEMLSRIMDTSDEWIRERSGVETRYYAEPGMATSDLGLAASEQALSSSGIGKQEIDMVIFATMTPDHFFPGSGGLLQKKLGLRDIPCYDIRQQCCGFLYALQLADAQIRAGMAGTVLVVAAETHTGFMPWSLSNFDFMYGRTDTPPSTEELEWNSRFRHLTVLFGDAGAAVVMRSVEDGKGGILDTVLHTDGSNYEALYVPGAGFKHRPYVDPGQILRGDHIPVMDGRFVFRSATLRMAEVAKEILQRNALSIEDVSLALMHQANKRINESVQKSLGLPDEKMIHNIQKYGNTTAATIPLLWDEASREGRIEPGDLVLMVAFGAGMNWGAALVRA